MLRDTVLSLGRQVKMYLFTIVQSWGKGTDHWQKARKWSLWPAKGKKGGKPQRSFRQQTPNRSFGTEVSPLGPPFNHMMVERRAR